MSSVNSEIESVGQIKNVLDYVLGEVLPNDRYLESLSGIDNAFVALQETYDQGTVSETVLYNLTAALVSSMITLFCLAEEAGMEQEAIREMLPRTYDLHAQSSFGRHIQEWPHGYPGDFEIVNAIVDWKESQPFGTIPGALGRLALASRIAQQHREKLIIQRQEIRQICRTVDKPRILSIACGPSRDLEQVQNDILSSHAEVWLVDFDRDALEESKRRLTGIDSAVKTIRADVKNPEALFEMLGEGSGFHLIYAGGLMDYLIDEFASYFLARLSPLVLKGGSILFTNINKGNPYRTWIEIMANWRLKERDEAEMRRLLDVTKLSQKDLGLEATGLTWIAKATRTDESSSTKTDAPASRLP